MKVEIDLSPTEVLQCMDWGDYWRENNPGEEYANSIFAKVANAVLSYDEIYRTVISD